MVCSIGLSGLEITLPHFFKQRRYAALLAMVDLIGTAPTIDHIGGSME
jgi:hypothetical protein